MATKAQKGMIPKKGVTAVLVKGCETWLPVTPGTFDIVEVNFESDDGGMSGGLLGIKFASIGKNGRPAMIFTAMDAVAGLQIEQPESTTEQGAG